MAKLVWVGQGLLCVWGGVGEEVCFFIAWYGSTVLTGKGISDSFDFLGTIVWFP